MTGLPLRAGVAGVWRALRRSPSRVALAVAALATAACFLEPGMTLPRRLFDHIVVLDVTQSMNVTDRTLGGKPASRLAFAKAGLQRALGELPCGSRLGWAIFTEYRSYLLFAPVEVCANRAELRASLAMIDPTMAWSGNSEIAKGLHSAFQIVRELPDKPSLVFITDGHEAPPLNPRFRPRFDDKPGEIPGLLVGVGDPRPSPIPKIDPTGRPLGVWGADDVLQTDPRSQGRGGSVGGEQMVDDGAAGAEAPMLGATPGAEHLSGLREPYLQLLARENGLGYLRLTDLDAFAEALHAPEFARRFSARADLRLPLAALALAALLAPYLRRLVTRLQRR